MGNCKIWILFCNEKMIQIDRCCFDIVYIVKYINNSLLRAQMIRAIFYFLLLPIFFFHTYRVRLKRKYLFRSLKKEIIILH